MVNKLNENDVKQYVRNDNHCPYCDSEDIENCGAVEDFDDEKQQPVRCNTCGKEWKDIFYLVGIELYDDDKTRIIPGQ